MSCSNSRVVQFPTISSTRRPKPNELKSTTALESSTNSAARNETEQNDLSTCLQRRDDETTASQDTSRLATDHPLVHRDKTAVNDSESEDDSHLDPEKTQPNQVATQPFAVKPLLTKVLRDRRERGINCIG